MKKILSILKKQFIPIVFVIILLVFQAQCDLTLPEYTSKIVNVGIQQSGIELGLLEVVRESEMDKILIFTDEKLDEKILSNYTLLRKEKADKKQLNKYKILKDENVYILNNISEKEKIELQKDMVMPLLVTYTFSSDNEKVKNMSQNFLKDFPAELLEDSNVFEWFASMPDEKIQRIITSFTDSYISIDESLINQVSIAAVKREYEIIGYELKDIQMKYLFSVGGKMLLIALIAMVITILSTFLASRIGSKFSRDLRADVVNKVMDYSNKEFKEFTTASLITRTTNDIQQVQILIVMLFRVVIYAPILGLGALSKVTGSSLGWIIGLAVLTIFSLLIILLVLVMPKFKKFQLLIDRINLVSREILTGLPVIRTFSNEKFEEDRFDEANKDLTKVSLFVNRVMNILMPTLMFIMNGVSVLIIWIGSSKVNEGVMQVGDLIAFISYSMQVIISFLVLSMISIILPRAMISIKRISEIFNKDIMIKEKDIIMDFNESKKGIVEFKDVYFRYPDAQEDILQNISFKALPGTTTAFIGSTGSGKSTLVNLIPRFFDVTGGKILVDGVNVKDVSITKLRDKIGYVPQKGLLFSGTIESNIKFGNDSLSDEEMKKVSEISQSLEFINEKKDKFKSKISQSGTNVSGGQKQRLSIARAIAKNPDIYIFDDSFSALDYQTDLNLRKALNKETKKSTILIVAQRISTILNADQIIVLDQGKVVGIGNHKELMKNCEVYKQIAISQLSKEELSNA